MLCYDMLWYDLWRLWGYFFATIRIYEQDISWTIQSTSQSEGDWPKRTYVILYIYIYIHIYTHTYIYSNRYIHIYIFIIYLSLSLYIYHETYRDKKHWTHQSSGGFLFGNGVFCHFYGIFSLTESIHFWETPMTMETSIWGFRRFRPDMGTVLFIKEERTWLNHGNDGKNRGDVRAFFVAFLMWKTMMFTMHVYYICIYRGRPIFRLTHSHMGTV